MTDPISTLTMALGPGGLLVVTLLAVWEPGIRPQRVQRALFLASWSGLLASLAAVVGTLAGGPRVAGLGRFDGLSLTLFTMVTLLVLVIARFSATYLEGDTRHGDFLGRLAATAASVEVLVLADNLLLFWLAWALTSVCLQRLLLFYPDRPRAMVAARKKFVVARLGDLCLAGAFVLLFRAFGSGSMERILWGSPLPGGQELLPFAGVLLALTALLKAAQFPTHGWLVEMMETPTPVSALLHAGILNAGPFLILRFSPLMAHAEVGAWILMLGGGFTAAFASVVLRTQPSLKVVLAYSSVAHMGFMLFICGLGVYPAAALHLVTHSFYKAHAFLSAGSVVEVSRAARVGLTPRRWSPVPVGLGFIVALSAYATGAWVLGLHPWENPSLLLVGAILVLGLTQLLGAGFDSPARVEVHLRVLALAGMVTFAFFGLEDLALHLLASSVPVPRVPPGSVLALGILVVAGWGMVVALQVLGWGSETALARELRVHLRHGLYANAWFDRLVAVPTPPAPQLADAVGLIPEEESLAWDS